MLSLFPSLFFLSPFAVTLLRAAAGMVFLLLAWTHYQKRGEFAHAKFPIVGAGTWIPVLTSAVELVIGLGLFLGIYTQIAAILGAITAAKSLIWKKRYPGFFPLSRTASALLLVICIALVVTGAGALAFDLPL